jgi:hypothetical protein
LNDVPAVAKGAGRNETVLPSRKPGFAAQPDVFVGFQLRHPQQTAEHLEPMALRQPGQIGDGFRDKSRGSSAHRDRFLPADTRVRRSPFFLAKNNIRRGVF